MKVSVILPTYKREDELKRALTSLYEQKFDNFEIVLIDDNDDELWNQRVERIVDSFVNMNDAVSLIYVQNHPNLGSARSRNVGIERARGEFITFLDDDDLYFENKIDRQYDFMIQNNLDYSITDLDLYFDDERVSEHRKREYIQSTAPEMLLKYHLMHHMTGTDTFMFRTSYLRSIGGFAPIDIGDEFYLMQRAIEGKGKFGYLSGCDVKAYVHTGEGGLSSGQGKIDGENQLFEYKKNLFDQLDKKSIRYIKMRHYAVLAFAYLRMKKYWKGLINGGCCFVSSPPDCIDLLLNKK